MYHLYYHYSEFFFSGRLPISSSFVWSGGFLPCFFVCYIFLCLLILLNLLCLGSPFHRLQVHSSHCFWCLHPVPKVGSVCCNHSFFQLAQSFVMLWSLAVSPVAVPHPLLLLGCYITWNAIFRVSPGACWATTTIDLVLTYLLFLNSLLWV